VRYLGFLLLSGCLGSNVVWGSTPTRVDPVHIRAGFQESSLIVAVPVVVGKRADGGDRSLLEVRAEVLMTKPSADGHTQKPNGYVIGPRIRW